MDAEKRNAWIGFGIGLLILWGSVLLMRNGFSYGWVRETLYYALAFEIDPTNASYDYKGRTHYNALFSRRDVAEMMYLAHIPAGILIAWLARRLLGKLPHYIQEKV